MRTLSTMRQCNRTHIAPSGMEARPDFIRGYSSVFGPLRHRLRLAFVEDQSIGSDISHLPLTGRPADISRFVVAIVIGVAVKRMIRRRPSPDRAKKLLKSCEAKFYPASAIASVVTVVRIVASTFSSKEGSQFRAPSTARAFSVSQRSSTNGLSLLAPARFSAAIKQSSPLNTRDVTAVAATVPQTYMEAILSRISDNGQAVEFLAVEVNKVRSAWLGLKDKRKIFVQHKLSFYHKIAQSAYTIKNAFDRFGSNVSSGTYNSASPTVALTLANMTSVAQPSGEASAPSTTVPDFAALIVEPGELDAPQFIPSVRLSGIKLKGVRL